MSSIDQINANRENAKHSTGPTSESGKHTCSLNSLKHGLASNQLIIPGESVDEFDALLTRLLHEHQPESTTEILCVEDMAKHHWLKDRAIRFQNDTMANTFAHLDKTAPHLPILFRYQTTNQRAYQCAFNNLITLKKLRLAERKQENGSASQKLTPALIKQFNTMQAMLEMLKNPAPDPTEISTMMGLGWFWNVVLNKYEWIGDEEEQFDNESDETEENPVA